MPCVDPTGLEKTSVCELMNRVDGEVVIVWRTMRCGLRSCKVGSGGSCGWWVELRASAKRARGAGRPRTKRALSRGHVVATYHSKLGLVSLSL